MNNKTIKKIQLGGWTKRRYKDIRSTINREIEKEENDFINLHTGKKKAVKSSGETLAS